MTVSGGTTDIAFANIMWKALIRIIAEKLYNHLYQQNLSSDQ